MVESFWFSIARVFRFAQGTEDIRRRDVERGGGNDVLASGKTIWASVACSLSKRQGG